MGWLEADCYGLVGVMVVVGLCFDGGDVADLAVEAAMVIPVDVFAGGELDSVEVSPWAVTSDQFSLVQTDR